MALYTVSMKQLIFNSLLISFVAAAVVILFLIGKEYHYLPVVVKNDKGECVKVVNFQNGDVYNCNDINIILRNYRSYAQ